MLKSSKPASKASRRLYRKIFKSVNEMENFKKIIIAIYRTLRELYGADENVAPIIANFDTLIPGLRVRFPEVRQIEATAETKVLMSCTVTVALNTLDKLKSSPTVITIADTQISLEELWLLLIEVRSYSGDDSPEESGSSSLEVSSTFQRE